MARAARNVQVIPGSLGTRPLDIPMILGATSIPSTMRVVSWNVNGLRATLKSSGRGLKALLDSLQADIICFQETKATS